MFLGSTQPLAEMSTRNIYTAVKTVGVCGWQPYHLHVPIVLKSWSLRLLEPSGIVQAYNGIGSKLYEVTVMACFKTHIHMLGLEKVVKKLVVIINTLVQSQTRYPQLKTK
jgi:hypothetical protein